MVYNTRRIFDEVSLNFRVSMYMVLKKTTGNYEQNNTKLIRVMIILLCLIDKEVENNDDCYILIKNSFDLARTKNNYTLQTNYYHFEMLMYNLIYECLLKQSSNITELVLGKKSIETIIDTLKFLNGNSEDAKQIIKEYEETERAFMEEVGNVHDYWVDEECYYE